MHSFHNDKVIFLAETKAKSKDPVKEKKDAAKTEKSQAKEAKQKLPTNLIIIAAIIVIAVALFIIFSKYALISSVPFSTFKSNLQSSPRISITSTYSSQSQLSNESACFASIIQVIAHSRQASTIDFYIINKENNTCTYSNTGLGGNVNPITVNSSSCLTHAYSEDGIFLNYSQTNSTTITLNRMYVYGNSAYLAKCPIAIELS